MESERKLFFRRGKEEAELAERLTNAAAKRRHRELSELYAERAKSYEWNEHRR